MIKSKELLKLCQRLDRKYDQRCSVRELGIMIYLLENGETAIGEISYQLRIGQPVVSRFIKKMETLGFALRSDGKASLTEEALVLFDDCIKK